MRSDPPDPGLSPADLREAARFAAQAAEEVLAVFERAHPDDGRPRAAVEAAWTFARGADRTQLQRITALAARRAAKEASTPAAAHAAHAAGDAAAAAYLHPPAALAGWTSDRAREAQVLHVLRPVAHAARAAELCAGDDPGVGDRRIAEAARRAAPTLVDLLRRYPPAPGGSSPVARLARDLDASLRAR